MKNKLLAFMIVMVLAALSQRVQAQNIIAEMPYKISKVSIVREYDRYNFLVYNNESGVDKSFNLIDISTNVCNTMDVSYLDVNDMEVVGEMAYFCGTWGANLVAGWFNIPKLFFMGDVIHYVIVPPALPCSYPFPTANETVMSLDRLDVIDYGVSNSHLVMIGRALCTEVGTPTQCIVEVYNNGTSWNVAYQVEHNDAFHYDDIAVTTNKIVVVGHKKYTEGEYITEFNLPTGMNNPAFFTSFPNYNTYSSSFPQYIPHQNSELLIDDIPGTSYFATVCQAIGGFTPGTLVEGTYLNLYSGASTVIFRCRIDDYYPLEYRELKYNAATNSFFLLMEDCSTNMNNGYYEFVLNNTYTAVTDVYFHQDISANTYFSIDKYTKEYPEKQSVLTGKNTADDFVIWNHDMKYEQNCTKTYSIPMYVVPNNSSYFYYDYPADVTNVILYSYVNTILQEELREKCVDK